MNSINQIISGCCLSGLRSLPDGSADCCITSPPYWGLRDYGTAQWVGGSPECQHYVCGDGGRPGEKQRSNAGSLRVAKEVCPRCGATRVDEQIGLEKTPEAYVQKLCAVFAEVYRVLKPTGTLWLNLGDSYVGGGRAGVGNSFGGMEKERIERGLRYGLPTGRVPGYKPKDLAGVPWMVAFALRSAGWYLRQDIIWHKPNPMPESVTDRCTKAHEYIFLLSKSQKYYFDHQAIQTDAKGSEHDKRARVGRKRFPTALINGIRRTGYYPRANRRSVWTVCTRPFRGAHFATFPPALVADCIRAGCPENGVVLDPFFGAGTTGVVARQLGRNFIGLELNPAYVTLAEERLREAALSSAP